MIHVVHFLVVAIVGLIFGWRRNALIADEHYFKCKYKYPDTWCTGLLVSYTVLAIGFIVSVCLDRTYLFDQAILFGLRGVVSVLGCLAMLLVWLVMFFDWQEAYAKRAQKLWREKQGNLLQLKPGGNLKR